MIEDDSVRTSQRIQCPCIRRSDRCTLCRGDNLCVLWESYQTHNQTYRMEKTQSF